MIVFKSRVKYANSNFVQIVCYVERSKLINFKGEKEVKFVGNKAKGRISKLVFQESKARQNFRKTNISYPRFEIRLFALLPTNYNM